MPKPTISIETRVAQSPELVGSSVGGQVALLSIHNGAYYGLDPVGSRIWELLARPQPVAELCDQILAEYQVGRPECEKQILLFLQKLSEVDLLRVLDEQAS